MLISWLEVSLQVANIINFLIFLHKGRYPTLTDRLVNLQPVSAVNQSRVVGYSYITRELLWHGILVSILQTSQMFLLLVYFLFLKCFIPDSNSAL